MSRSCLEIEQHYECTVFRVNPDCLSSEPVDSCESRLVVDRGGLLLEQLKLHEKLLEPLMDEVQLVLESGRSLQLPALPVRVNLLVHLRQQIFLILEFPKHLLKWAEFWLDDKKCCQKGDTLIKVQYENDEYT